MQATIVFKSNFSKNMPPHWQRWPGRFQPSTRPRPSLWSCEFLQFDKLGSVGRSAAIVGFASCGAAAGRISRGRMGGYRHSSKNGPPRCAESPQPSRWAKRLCSTKWLHPTSHLEHLAGQGIQCLRAALLPKWLVSRTLSSNFDLYRFTKRRQPGSATASWLSYAMFKQSCCRW